MPKGGPGRIPIKIQKQRRFAHEHCKDRKLQTRARRGPWAPPADAKRGEGAANEHKRCAEAFRGLVADGAGGGKTGEYALSILAALLGVACSLAPYFIMIRIITGLVNGTAELSRCLTLCLWMAGF